MTLSPEVLSGLRERVLRGDIKALSIKQPYPHHIFHDGKDVENRDWPTKGRGWPCKRIAADYGISESLPREIAKGRTWKDANAQALEVVKWLNS